MELSNLHPCVLRMDRLPARSQCSRSAHKTFKKRNGLVLQERVIGTHYSERVLYSSKTILAPKQELPLQCFKFKNTIKTIVHEAYILESRIVPIKYSERFLIKDQVCEFMSLIYLFCQCFSLESPLSLRNLGSSASFSKNPVFKDAKRTNVRMVKSFTYDNKVALFSP